MDFNIAFNVLENELEECSAFCLDNGLGIELTTFAYPKNLDQNLEEHILRHKKAVNTIDLVSVRGPFFDLFTTSPDPAIVEVCKKRHKAALGAAIEVGTEMYVAISIRFH